MLAILSPDVDIVPGDEPLLIPSFDFTDSQSKRAIQMIPLLAGLGVPTGVATGTTGIGMESHLYRKLSLQLVNDIPLASSTIFNLQKIPRFPG